MIRVDLKNGTQKSYCLFIYKFLTIINTCHFFNCMAFKQKHLKSNMEHFDTPIDEPRIFKDQCASEGIVNILMTISFIQIVAK